MSIQRIFKSACIGTVILLSLPAAAAERPGRPYSDVEHWAAVFDSPERSKWQQTRTVLDLIGLRDGDVVADIGAGTGFFTSMLSYEVGTRGRVYAVDTEPAMVDYIKARDDTRQSVVFPVVAEADDPKLPDGEIDVALIVNTWHHIKKRRPYLGKLERAMSRSGRVVIVDFIEGDLPVGPPRGKKLARDRVVAEFKKAGWRLESESLALPYQYLLIFYPPAKTSA